MKKKFAELKKEALSIDKSHKQSWDKPVVPLLNLLNESPDCYTISSCSGRIVLMEYMIPKEENRKETKYDASFLYTKHEEVEFDDIMCVIESLDFSPDRTIWFQQEPVILHIRFLELNDDVKEIVKIFRSVGFKKSGIFGFDHGKIHLEVVGLEIMKMIIMQNGESLPSKEYFKIMIEEANKRVKRGHIKIENALMAIRNFNISKRVLMVSRFWFGEEMNYLYESKLRKKLLKNIRKKNRTKRIFKTDQERNIRIQKWKEYLAPRKEEAEEEEEGEQEDEVNVIGMDQEKEGFFELYDHLWRNRGILEKTIWFGGDNSVMALLISCNLFNQNRFCDKESREERKKFFKDLGRKVLFDVLFSRMEELFSLEKVFCYAVLETIDEKGEEIEKLKECLKESIRNDKSVIQGDKTNIFVVFGDFF